MSSYFVEQNLKMWLFLKILYVTMYFINEFDMIIFYILFGGYSNTQNTPIVWPCQHVLAVTSTTGCNMTYIQVA